MALTRKQRERALQTYIDLSARDAFTDELNSMFEELDAQDPGLLENLRTVAIDLRRSGALPRVHSDQKFRNTMPPHVGERPRGILAETASQAAQSPVVEALDTALTPLTRGVEAVGALSAGLTPGEGKVYGTVGEGQGIVKDVLQSMAGEAAYVPPIDIMNDPVLDGLPLENTIRTVGQTAAEIGMAVPGVGSAAQAAFETKAPVFLDVPRAFVRTLGEFALGAAGAAARGAAGGLDDAALLAQQMAIQQATARGATGLASAGAVGSVLGQQGTADDAAIAGLGTALGARVGMALPVKNMREVAGVTAASIPLVDAPVALAANPDILARYMEGEELTEEDRQRLVFEIATTGLGAVAGVAGGALEARSRNAPARARAAEIDRLAKEAQAAQVAERSVRTEQWNPQRLAEAFNLTEEQAVAADALARALGVDTRNLEIRKGSVTDVPEGVLASTLAQDGPDIPTVRGSGRPEDQGTEALVPSGQPDGPWRSNILDALQNWQGKGTKQQLMAHLQKFKGAKAEAEALGLDAMLGDNVTKQEVAAAVEQARMPIEEKVLGEPEYTKPGVLSVGPLENGYFDIRSEDGRVVNAIEPLRNGMFALHRDIRGMRAYKTVEEALEDVQGAYNNAFKPERIGGTKFENYQLPGAQNYREVLLKAPEDQNMSEADRKLLDQLAEEKRLLDQAKEYRELARQERLANGETERYERLMELDSESREEAYSVGPTEQDRNRRDWLYRKKSHWGDEPNVLGHLRVNDRTTPSGEKVLFVEELQSDWAQDARSGKDVPKMPFEKTDQWVGLLMKRALKMAEEGGYDRVAWTRGDQQAARYDLSKQVESIGYSKDGDDYRIQAYKDGNKVIDEMVPDSKLEDTVGKEVADRMRRNVGVWDESEGEYRMEGLDLQVGGEGMKSFYDQIVPKTAEKLVKPLGAKVEKVDLGGEVGEVMSIPVTKGIKDQAKRGFYLFQDEGPTPASPAVGRTIKGAAEFAQDGKTILHGFEAADFTTGIHEIAHVARRQLLNLATAAENRLGITDDHIRIAEEWAGAKDGDWSREAEEKFARGFERYLTTGKAPNASLRTLFNKIKNWMLDIYGQIRGSDIDVKISKPMKEVFDALITRGDAPPQARRGLVAKEANRVIGNLDAAVANRSTPEARQELFERLTALADQNNLDPIGVLEGARVVEDRLFAEPREVDVPVTEAPAYMLKKDEYRQVVEADPENFPKGVDAHEAEVRKAIEKGEEIPRDVLSEYPELYDAYLARQGEDVDALVRALEFPSKNPTQRAALDSFVRGAESRRSATKRALSSRSDWWGKLAGVMTPLDRIAPFRTAPVANAPIEFSGIDRVGLSRALGFEPEAAVASKAAAEEGRVDEARMLENEALPPNVEPVSAQDFRYALSLEAMKAYDGMTADDINAAIGIPLGVDEKLNQLDPRAVTLRELEQDARTQAGVADSIEETAALVAKADQYADAARRVEFQQNAIGIMLREVGTGSDAERGAALRRIRQAGAVRRELFPSMTAYNKGEYDLSSPEHLAKQKTILETMERTGEFRNRDEAEAFIQAVEGSYAGNKARSAMQVAGDVASGIVESMDETMRAFSKDFGLALDIPHMLALGRKDFTAANALDSVLQAELRGVDPIGFLGRGIRMGARAITGWGFASSALRELRVAADADPAAALVLQMFTDQGNREMLLRVPMEQTAADIMGSKPPNAAEVRFMEAPENDYLAFLAGVGEEGDGTAMVLGDPKPGGGRQVSRIAASRENLIRLLERRGVKNAADSYPVRALDAWNVTREYGERLAKATGIPLRDKYVHHTMRAQMRASILDPTRIYKADGSMETKDEARLRILTQWADSDIVQRRMKGLIKTQAEEMERRKVFIDTFLSVFNDDPTIAKSVEGLRDMIGVPPARTGDSVRDMKNLGAQASLAHRRTLDIPEYLIAKEEQGGDGIVPILERDGGQIVQAYIRDLSRMVASRGVFGGSDNSGAPMRLLSAFEQMQDGNAQKIAADLFEVTTFGHLNEQLPAVFAAVFHPPLGSKGRSYANAARTVGSAALLSGSWFSQLLGFFPMVRDFGFMPTIKQTLGAPVYGRQLPVATKVFGTRGLKKLMENSTKEAIKGRQGLVEHVRKYQAMGLDPMAQPEINALFDAFDMTSRLRGEFMLDRMMKVEGTADVEAATGVERGAHKVADLLLKGFGIRGMNYFMDKMSANVAIQWGEGLSQLIQNPNASMRARGDAAHDLKQVGLNPAKVLAMGLDDQDRMLLARYGRARTNFTTPTNLERPFMMRSWFTRQLFALQSISFIQGINAAQAIDDAVRAGFRPGDLWTNPSDPAKRVIIGVLGASVLAGLYKDLLGDIFDNVDPTESETANVALQSVSELGWSGGVVQSLAYADKLGIPTTVALGEAITGGAPSLLNSVSMIDGVLRLSAGQVIGDGDLPKDLEQLAKTVPGIRRMWHLAKSDDSLNDGSNRVFETFEDSADEIDSILEKINMGDLLGAFGVLLSDYEAGQELKRRQRWDRE